MQPELAGNPLVPRMFELLDDGDGFLTLQEFLQVGSSTHQQLQLAMRKQSTNWTRSM